MGIGDDIRAHKQEIATRWEALVRRDLPALEALSRSALIDHMPEFLEGLAAWIAGELVDAERGFRLLAEGHALQRHSAGIDLGTLTAEYAALRRVTLEVLLERSDRENLVRSLVRLAAGFDQAIAEAVRRYAGARDHVRERFIGILAHDLRDPLTAVMMSATLLADTTLADKQAKLVDRITRSARRIERMIDDVLDFARGRLSGGIPVDPKLCDMGEICTAAVDEARAGTPGRPVLLETRGDLRGFFDRERVRQALANLISNAVFYGTGELRVRAWERDDHHALLVSVTNEGPIIPASELARIFDPFSRVTPDSGLRRGGLGLGLFIVQQIALAHGGVCHAASGEDGTTFTLELPRTPLDEMPDRPTD